jgi:hypothetical protein
MKRYPPCVALCVLVLTFASVAAYPQKSRKSVSAAEVTGTYRMNFTGKYRGNYNEIEIASTGRGKLRIEMELTYPYTANREQLANVGSLDGEAVIAGDLATYTSTEYGQCTITIKFVRPGLITVNQTDSGCGFGFNVEATGTYHKVSSRKPKFEDQELGN